MSQQKIALFVASPLRDLAGVVLTAFELCQMGAVCYLVPQVDGFNEILALAPDFVLLPALRPYYAPRVEKYLEAGIQFGLNDSEGVVWSSMDEYAQTLWKDPGLTEQAKCICMWGPEAAEYTVSNAIFNKARVFVTGCPRFDFYSDSLSAVYKKMIAPPGWSDRKLVLINTNFTIGNYSDLSPEEMFRNFERNYGIGSEEMTRLYELEKKAIQDFIILARSLAADFPRVDVVVRPHPQEREETYAAAFEGLPNLCVSKSGAVNPWILRASVVIQKSCTTATEAALAGIPALSPGWIKVGHSYPAPEAVSVNCADYSVLKEAVSSILLNSYKAPDEILQNTKSIVEKWFYKNDGMAHARVSRAIIETSPPGGEVDRKHCLKLLYGLHKRSSGRSKIPALARYAMRADPGWSFRQMRPASREQSPRAHLNLPEIHDLVGAIQQTKNAESGVPVKVSTAKEAGAYIAHRYRGRAVVMQSC